MSDESSPEIKMSVHDDPAFVRLECLRISAEFYKNNPAANPEAVLWAASHFADFVAKNEVQWTGMLGSVSK